jgi:PAS domain S-box-containing protein
MKKVLNAIGYREKLIGAFSLLTLILIVVLFFLIYRAEKKILIEGINQHAVNYASLISDIINQESSENISMALNKTLQKSSILYLDIVMPDNVPYYKRVLVPDIFKKATTSNRYTGIQKGFVIDDTYYDFIFPFSPQGEAGGYIRIGMDISPIQKGLLAQTDTFLLAFIISLIFGIFLSIILGKSLEEPIRKLANYTNEIANGNLNQSVDITSKDELGRLANSFNMMAKKLEESKSELTSYQKSLERKIAEQHRSLTESEEKYRNLVEMSPDLILIVQDDHVVFSNHRVDELFNISANQIRNESINNLTFIHPADREKFISKITVIPINDSQVYTFDIQAITREGRELIMDVSAHRMQYNNMPALQIILRDITQRKKFDIDLLQIQKMESIGTLASGISHDFNNILGVIIPNAELIKNMSEHGSTIYKEAEQIESAALKASELTGKLLSFSRKEELKIEVINPNIILKNLMNLVTRLIGKSISVSVYLDPNIKNIAIDVNQIEQAILNIVLNARDAMPNGGKLVIKTSVIQNLQDQLNLSEISKEKEYCKIELIDSGCGMDEDTQKKVFEPFFTTKKAGHGTGLGLSTVCSIVQNHKGFISIDSKPGKGTGVTIYLPSTSAQATAEKTKSLMPNVLGEGEILVIEDDMLMLETMKNLLGHLGFEVITAVNGKQALEIYSESKSKIKLIILDMEMPIMNGLETLRKLKEIDINVKVLISSGYSMEEKVQTALNEGALAFLKKPYRITDLAKTIQSTISDTKH